MDVEWARATGGIDLPDTARRIIRVTVYVDICSVVTPGIAIIPGISRLGRGHTQQGGKRQPDDSKRTHLSAPSRETNRDRLADRWTQGNFAFK
jgi:hypothetical protein